MSANSASMSTQSYIANRTLLAVDQTGRELQITFAIPVPYEVSPHEWSCPVLLEGLYEHLVDQHGIDSWQSLQLAYQLIVQLLDHFVQGGGRLVWPEERTAVIVGELIPHLADLSGQSRI